VRATGKRFAATLGELVGGRVGLSCGSVRTLKMALATAVRYVAQRRQFGPGDSMEIRASRKQHKCLLAAA
jgi:acyl-CoA oxidase